jgi:ABC-type polysaccharide/polyol phosphate export permease
MGRAGLSALCRVDVVIAKEIIRLARLTWNLARIEFDAQRKETVSGLIWVALWPLLQVGGFLLVFHFVRGGSRHTDSAAILAAYLGVLVWSAAVTVLMSNLRILSANRELIMHIRFPITILSIVDVTVKYVLFLVQLVVALGIWLAVVPNDQWYLALAYLPLYLVAFYCALVVMAWLASLIGAAVPEVASIIPPMLVVLLALSPVFQPDLEALPWMIQRLNDVNPFSIWVSAFYATIGVSPAGPSAPIMLLGSSLIAVACARVLVDLFYRNVARVI